MSEKGPTTFEFEGFRLDVAEMRLWRESDLLHVAPKALEILVLLLRHQGEIVSREQIMDQVWGDAFVEDGNLNVHISNLRKIFSDNSLEQIDFIETIPKHGYRFLVEAATGDSNEKPGDERVATNAPPRTEPVDRGRQVRWHFVAIVLLGTFLVSSFALWLRFGDGSGLSGIPVEDREINSFAVLPFTTLGKKGESEMLSLGITDALISRLGSLNRFAVRPLTAVSKFPESGMDPIEFGKELKVDAALVGTIQEADDKLRLNVRAIDVRDGAILWTGSFDESGQEVLKLQDSLSIRVANGLLSEISRGETNLLTRRITDHPDAYRLYLQGKFFLGKRTEPGIRRSIGYFEDALKIDPDFAEAYVGIADANWLLSEGKRGYSSPRDVIQKVRKSIARALEINPELADAYVTLADIQLYHDWDHKSAESSFLKAIRLNPNLDKAHHWYAWLLISDGRFEKAEAHFKIARELNPTSLIIAAESGYPPFAKEDFGRAIDFFEAALELDPSFLDAHIGLFRAYRATGKADLAARELSEIKRQASEKSII
ncbi:MAG: winged helix-turn-helix domain-containing protein [Acidobacteriota bacterium]|nr:winged helix-turn-helix domain-containing protein [Acidobacteriota bacterium]